MKALTMLFFLGFKDFNCPCIAYWKGVAKVVDTVPKLLDAAHAFI